MFQLKDIKISIWGLTYKSGTDTLRRSLAIELCEWLIEQNAEVYVYDPIIKELPENLKNQVNRMNTPQDSIESLDALIVGTPDQNFIKDFEKISLKITKKLTIIDPTRHLHSVANNLDVNYISVGSVIKNKI